MVSKKDNELLTLTGPGTPMGELFRRYWVPALLSDEIPEPDSPPVRVRLLGEELVAFRDSQGRVGLLGELCSHRRASLFYGRNEESGLRCVYHGWKYDVHGKVLETPAEPDGSRLAEKVKHPAYPCREASGVVFTYMGPPEKMPLFPAQEWLTLARDRVGITKFFLESNYLQALEGDCDTSHTAYLHRGNSGEGIERASEDGAPRFEVEQTWCGLRAAAIRRLGSEELNVRVSTFAMPFIGNVPVGPMADGKLDGYLVVYQVPVDDYSTWRYNFRFKRSAPILNGDLIEHDQSQIARDYTLIANRDNGWLLDREIQRRVNYTGVHGFATQDAYITESMGRITDRTKETLGASDRYVVSLRAFLLKAVKAFQKGEEPPGLAYNPSENDFRAAVCTIVNVPTDASWREAEAAMYG